MISQGFNGIKRTARSPSAIRTSFLSKNTGKRGSFLETLKNAKKFLPKSVIQACKFQKNTNKNGQEKAKHEEKVKIKKKNRLRRKKPWSASL